MKNFIKTIFYGNIFYGLCTVALSIESNLQHRVSLNSPRLYILIFLATAVFYSSIYYKSSAHINVDDRTDWYRKNRSTIKVFLTLSTVAIAADILLMAFVNRRVFYELSVYHWLLLGIVPLIGLMYSFHILPVKKLRGIGWLKPFVIGFVWAGVVTIFPIMFWQVQHPGADAPHIIIKTLLWLQNFIFISALAVVFDIKDYHSDKKHKLNTYPATYGINNTLRFIVAPLTIFGLALLVVFNIKFGLPVSHTLLQSVPYIILLLLVRKSFDRERSLLFYLAIIDGLMLLKAICGIISITMF